jgi:hypothetical protein
MPNRNRQKRNVSAAIIIAILIIGILWFGSGNTLSIYLPPLGTAPYYNLQPLFISNNAVIQNSTIICTTCATNLGTGWAYDVIRPGSDITIFVNNTSVQNYTGTNHFLIDIYQFLNNAGAATTTQYIYMYNSSAPSFAYTVNTTTLPAGTYAVQVFENPNKVLTTGYKFILAETFYVSTYIRPPIPTTVINTTEYSDEQNSSYLAVAPNSTFIISGRIPSGGTPPYTYKWYLYPSNTIVGTADNLTTSIGTGSALYELVICDSANECLVNKPVLVSTGTGIKSIAPAPISPSFSGFSQAISAFVNQIKQFVQNLLASLGHA